MESLRIRFPLRNNLGLVTQVGRDLGRSLVARSTLVEVAAAAIVRAPNAGERAFPHRAGEIRIAVEGAELALAMVDTPRPRGTIFLLHGIRDAKESLRGWAALLARSGYRAILVDLRGHGRSTGDYLGYGAHESRDLARVLDAIEARGLRAGPVGAVGYSYGAGVALQWAGADSRIAAVVSVASFATLREVVKTYLPLRPPEAFVERTLERAGELGGFDIDAASPVAAIARTAAPALLLHGVADERIPFHQAEAIRAARPSRTELVLVPGAAHKGVVVHPVTALATRLPAWLEANLARSPA